MLNKFRTAKTIFTHFGLRGIIIYITRLIINKVENRSLIFALSINSQIFESKPIPESHAFRTAAKEDFDTILSDPQLKIRDRDVFAYKEGDQCLLHFYKNELVGYSWIRLKQYSEITFGFHLNLPDSVAYNYNEFTLPYYRGRGFHKYRQMALIDLATKFNKQYLLASVNHLNLKSIKAVKKSGYKHVGTFRYSFKREQVLFSLKMSQKFWKLHNHS